MTPLPGLDPLERPAPQVLEGLEDCWLRLLRVSDFFGACELGARKLREKISGLAPSWGSHATCGGAVSGDRSQHQRVSKLGRGPGSRRAPVSDLRGALDLGSYSY